MGLNIDKYWILHNIKQENKFVRNLLTPLFELGYTLHKSSKIAADSFVPERL
jgi:hypothetical protein